MHPSHPFWSQEVPRLDGQLLLTPCPGTQQVALPLTLNQLRLAQLGETVEREGLRWFHLPIEDDQAPDANFELAWQQTLPQLLALLREGQHLTIHCKGGSGRTGLVAAALLMSLGQPRQEAMAAIKAHRPKAFTLACHRQWLDQLAERLDQCA
ncbi:tyrosine-protein phosphatase [Aeromonas dhakensis]|uniref:phosphatase domain-containing putative toxin n=1 Tax=Aeromonas dhakensis TaxID=196024 RepID=UPI003B9ED3E9